ncbi:hypothetical protein COSHB9_24580 [Companilactobacillus alimentarius]|uniref:Uncharacterized protein n=1 Tax=Companilactobacillus alimentarius DSM 20249 TaxID=1423720 RepID=A0A2K9HF04_9LACO|nr:hypothetical protein [Companilactobacillus alimentarius]AUI71140.1 hypothetical protein LA20249_02515 [Companilactobacillus alimentarius DSM 20249]KRK75266.1 hypothetical protein FC67_GL001780 [Companilactobacillus alimentarius DSM 20249]GEO43955.1 hypothetical protein LAL01_01870 [Companilactobacillus alimentarius]
MKVTKLVVGILMIILSVFIFFESSAAGFVNVLENKGNTSGSAGIILSIGYLAVGIVYIATRNKTNLGGDIISAVILGLFGFIGLSNSDNVYQDLIVWIILGFIIGFGFLIWHIIVNKLNSKKISQQNIHRNNLQNNSSLPTRAQYRSNHRSH